jgi:hypothetical protein
VPDTSFDPEQARILYGRAEAPPARVPVRAGPLALILEEGDVRHVHLGDHEIVRRIYGAVRDQEWRTIPPVVSRLEIDAGDDRFRCRYHAEHRDAAVAFGWDATIEGAADGTLAFTFDGIAQAPFLRNRIGLCLLHPIQGLAGGRVHLTTTGGARRAVHFPEIVAVEQPIAGFTDIAQLACEIEPGLWLEATVEGDVFETEDQRAWIDASYKTYGTPVGLPRPVAIAAGDRVWQRITLRLMTEGGLPAEVPSAPAVIIDRPAAALRFATGRLGHLPAIGLRQPATTDLDAAAALLRQLGPAHLRVDVDLTGSRATAAEAMAAARALATSGAGGDAARPLGIELALHVPADAGLAAGALDAISAAGIPMARVLALTAGQDSTRPATLAAVQAWRTRQRLQPVPPIATGTAGDLAKVHISRPAAGEAICWAMHPQAHATDATSIVETPRGAHDQVVAVRKRFPGQAMAILATFGHPRVPDPRVPSLLAAGWTLALIAALGEAGADSLTLGDAIGSAAAPGDLPAIAAAHLVAAVTGRSMARFRLVASTLPTLQALALEDEDVCSLFVANLAARPCDVTLPERIWWLRRLDDDALRAPGGAPDALTAPRTIAINSARLQLGPYAIARLDGLPG